MPRKEADIEPGGPGERIPGEGQAAYASWCVYRDLGAERSIRLVAQAVSKSTNMIKRWSVRHNWVQRAAEWDAHCDEETRKALAKARARMAKEHAEAARLLREKTVAEIAKRNPNDARWQDLVAMLAQAVKVERLALGEPTESTHTEVTGKDGGPVRVVSWAEAALASVEGAKEPGNDDT